MPGSDAVDSMSETSYAASEAATGTLALLELHSAILREVVLCLWQDPRDVAAFSCCSRTTAALCDDQLLWRELVLRRCGESVLPGVQPAPWQYRPEPLEGWVFFQGVDGSREGDTDLSSNKPTLQQLEEACRKADGDAFTTSGKVIKDVKAQHQWQRVSYKPNEGMYVRQTTVEVLNMDLPAPEPPSADQGASGPCWPPHVPGWIYFPSSISTGYFVREPPANLSTYPSLTALLQACLTTPGIVAVTTAGETKRGLRPQACWRTAPEYDVGLYVKEHVATARNLVPHPAVPDYRRLAARLHQLRLTAGQMDAAWVDDQHLSVVAAPDAPAGSGGVVLQLHDVWWLDISGSVAGVPPGEYDVVWHMDAFDAGRHAILQPGTIFNLSATATPIHPHQQPNTTTGVPSAIASSAPPTAAAAGPDAEQQQQGGGDGAPASGAAGAAVQLGSVTVQVTAEQLLQQVNQQCARSRWMDIHGGVLRVAEFSTVALRFFSLDTWKSRMRWAYAELRPRGQQDRRHQQQQQQGRRLGYGGGGSSNGSSGGRGRGEGPAQPDLWTCAMS